jgi:hypothetical protein
MKWYGLDYFGSGYGPVEGSFNYVYYDYSVSVTNVVIEKLRKH